MKIEIGTTSQFLGHGKNKKKIVSCSSCNENRWVRFDSNPLVCSKCSGRKNGAKAIREKTGKFKSCLYCSSEYWEYKHQCNLSKFCSTNCANEAKRKYEKEIRKCKQCSCSFQTNDKPFSNSTGEYCSSDCKVAAFSTGVFVVHKSTKQAANARYAVGAAIKRGLIKRPSICDQCGGSGRIEAAHYNYIEKLNVRWLCVPCHRKWDSETPKGGAVRVDLREKKYA